MGVISSSVGTVRTPAWALWGISEARRPLGLVSGSHWGSGHRFTVPAES